MNKNYLIVVCGLLLFSLSLFAQDFYSAINKVDSIGRKRGIWIEYEVVPKYTEDRGEYEWFISPLDSMKRYNVKNEDFTEVVVFRWFGLYKNGVKEGEWTKFRIGGSIVAKVNYLNGVLNGDYLEYYINGKIKIKCKIDKNRFISDSCYNEKGEFIYASDSIDKVDFIESFYNPAR